MTNNNFSKILNNILWFVVYTLPLFIFIGVSIKNGAFTDFETVFSSLGLTLTNDNIILQALNDIFGTSGVLPLFVDTSVLIYASYFASCYLIHFICDVILWIVRWAHDLMNKGGKDLWK